MKKGIHPENYRPVVFKDMSNGDMFLTKSTAKTNDTVEFEGETYPVVKVEISSSSHPFYTTVRLRRSKIFLGNDTYRRCVQGSCICLVRTFIGITQKR